MADKPVHDLEDAPAPAGDAAEEAPPADSTALLQRERNEFHDRWLRTTAEFDNYRKRVERERREQADHQVTGLLEDLLLVIDDFDRALTVETGEAGKEATAYRKGVELIHAKLNDLLRKRGVRPFDAVGKDFDPKLHQAVVHESSPEHREGEVIADLQRGYMIGERLLRPAMVKVAKA
ncbi:MAG: nucleotide exchange factor GrpE [Acidobacteriota bacterium]